MFLLEPMRDVHATVLIGDVSGIPDEIAAASGWFENVPAGAAELTFRLINFSTVRRAITVTPGSRFAAARCRRRRPCSS